MSKAIIEIEQLKKDYYLGEQTVPVLKGINLAIQKEEYVALMGPSGSGKSTLMNIIGCLDNATAGSYILNEQDISLLKDKKLATIRSKEIGFVFQQFNLLPRLTALENVALPLIYAGINKKQRVEIAQEMLRKVDLADRAHHKPNELSGGQCQRVAIARALSNSPSLILADEPTGNLDTKTSDEIMEIFATLNAQGNTIVIVTHEEDIAAKAKRIIRLRDGIIESSTFNKKVHIPQIELYPTKNESLV
jgi:putative ABC transport system ATP-binding protein